MYEHDLAERLHMTVSELEERMTIEEFTRWMARDDMIERERKRRTRG